ncbi:hypothetical protein NDU88_002640 [Pleurodeles waltl]|uniref:Uncharacterized protein n=1 Tax=Pleurodeles waltl TaxID=8319 RepID=A0AAV7NEA2_PLEWA|nr:hypothetical protein NDU88_002640 [Pleurodeles waltl]
MAPTAHRPHRQLSSPPFGLVLLSSGALMVQRWVGGSPPRVRWRTAALWSRFTGGARRPGTVPQLCLNFRPPPQQLSSPPFDLVLLPSGGFTVQRWVAWSPPRVRQHVAALWPWFVSNMRRPRTAPQLGLCFVFVSSRHRGPAFSVRA